MLAPFLRLCVNRVFQEANTAVGFFNQRVGVPNHSVDQSANSFNQDQCCHFPTIEDVIPDGEFFNHDATVSVVISNALINAFVSSARNDDSIEMRKFFSFFLVKRDSRRCGDCENALSGLCSDDGVQRLSPDIRPHDHTRTPTVRSVINRSVTIMSPRTQVMDVNVQLAALTRLPHKREVKRSKVLRENTQQIDTHRLPLPQRASMA